MSSHLFSFQPVFLCFLVIFFGFWGLGCFVGFFPIYISVMLLNHYNNFLLIITNYESYYTDIE